MATNYAIKTEFHLSDKSSATLAALGKKGQAMQSVLGGSLLAAEKRFSALGEVAKKAAVGVAAVGTAALTAGIAIATKRFIEFDDALAAAGAHFSDLDVTSSDYQKSLDALKNKALEVSGSTRFMATDTVGALNKMAMAGFSSEQAMAMLAGTAAMATAANVDLTSGVDMVTDAMGAFNLVKDELGQPLGFAALEANVNHMGDVVALATKKANFGMSEWFESVKAGATLFSTYGGSLEDFTAMAGVLANVGTKGGEAGTAIRNIMTRLAAPTDKASMALESLGISIYDSNGKMLPFLDILSQFETQLATLSEESRNNKLKTIFGREVTGSFLALLNEGSVGIARFRDELEMSQGAAEATANAMNQSLGGRIEILKSALETLGIRLIDAFKPKAVPFVDRLTEIVDDFSKNVLPRVIDEVERAIPKILKFINTLSKIAKTIWNLKWLILPVIALMKLWQISMMAVVVVLKVINAAMVIHSTVTKFLASGTKAAAAAQWVMNAAMAACPVLLIVAGIVLLVGLIVVLIGKWEAVSGAIDGFFDKVRNMSGIGSYVLKFLVAPFEMVWRVVRSVIDIFEAFIHGGFINGIKMIGLAILQALAAPLQYVLQLLSFMPWFSYLNTQLDDWFAETRAGILNYDVAGAGEASSAAMLPPTQTAAQASSYSETNSVSSVQIGLEKDVTADKMGAVAPNVTVSRTNSGSFDM